MASPTQMIFTQICAVMNDISAVGKTQKNQKQGYSFRGIDQVYNELHSILARHQVFTVPEILDEKSHEKISQSGGVLIYRILKIKYTFYAEDGSNVSAVVIGEGMDSGDKASNKAMAVAHKYALTQVFCIPTEDAKDPEHDSHEIKDEPKDDPMASLYQGTGEQKAYLMKACQAKGITEPTMMGKISAALQLKHVKMRDVADLIAPLFKEISNGDK